MQLSHHIGKAAWSIAGKTLFVVIIAAFILAQKVIGERHYGVYAFAQALVTALYMLTDSFSLQPMVNFGMEESKRAQAFTISAVCHVALIGVVTTVVWLLRSQLAAALNEPLLVPVLDWLPLASLGFLLRHYFLKVAQLYIDPRGTFMIDLGWIGTTMLLVLLYWRNGSLVHAEQMMTISAIATGVSSLVGLLLYGGRVRFTTQIDKVEAVRMIRFGLAQSGSAVTLALQTQGDIMILKAFVGSALVGNYDAAKKIFRGFEALRDAGALLTSPSAARLAVQRRFAELAVMTEKTIAFMLLLIVPAVLVIWLAPIQEVFGWIYRDKYREAPEIFRYLSLGALAIPFSMNTFILSGMGRVRDQFRVTITAAIISTGVSLSLVPTIGVTGAAIGMAVSYVVLGIGATRAVTRRLDISLPRALGRWRDAGNFALRAVHAARNRVRGGQRSEE